MPLLTNLESSVTFGENTVNAVPQLLDVDVAFSDPEGDFAGGTLVVSGLLAEDIVSIRNQGTGAGEIALTGNTVFFENTAIGTVSGGSGSSLTVTFNASATSASIEALIENLTYANSSDEPTASRTLSVTVTDAAGEVTAVLGEQTWSEVVGAGSPTAGIDTGDGRSAPAATDLNGDGLIDLVVGSLNGLKVYYNTGTASAAQFTEQVGPANPFSGITFPGYPTPTFGDINGDGTTDLVFGGGTGIAQAFVNLGTAASPNFVELTGGSNPFAGIGLSGGTGSGAALGDLNGDGLLDFVLGGDRGGEQIRIFQNTGTATAPVFTELTGGADPLAPGGPGDALPTLVDVNGDGRLDIVSGGLSGIHTYLNVGSGGTMLFEEAVGNPFAGIDGGIYVVPGFGDLNGDGLADLLLGSESNVAGQVRFFENTTPPPEIVVNVTAENDAPSLTATGGTPTFIEGGAAVDLFSGVTVDTGEAGQSIDQITLTVDNLADGADELLGVDGTAVELTDGTSGTTGANGIGYNVSVVGGVATVTLSMLGGISSADAQTLIDGLSYSNASDNPDTTDRVVTLTGIRDTGGGGDTASVSIGATVSIAAENDAPTLSGGPVALPPTDEDFPNAEVTVADLLAGTSFADVDGDDVGIAVTDLTGNGDWEYSTDGGFTWLSVGSVSDGHALLLSPDTLVSYAPDGIDGETATIEFRAWDQTAGTPSDDTTPQYADTSVNGGTTAYSGGTAQASVEVAAVNDAPLFRLSPGLDFVVTFPDDGFVDVISGDGDGGALTGSSEDGGDTPTKVVLGDFDNDGDLDVAVTSPTAGTVTVLENDSCGCMEPFETSPISVTPAPVSMVSGDFNGDGNLDLFVGNTSGIMANLLLGAGDGSFTTSVVPMAFGFGLAELVAGDFNGDKELDVAATVSGGVIVGTGDGKGGFTFGIPTPVPGVIQPGALAVGDMDGGNGVDLVVADAVSGALSLLTNNGLGGFTSTSLPTGLGPTTDVQLGDLNGDGKLDIAFSTSGVDMVSVMLNIGDGTFLAPTAYSVGQDPSSLALADMNSDGALDIVVLNKGSEDIDVLLGKGDGTFSQTILPIPTFGVPGDIAIGQMDTDNEWQYPRFLTFTEGDTLALAPRLELADIDPDGGTAVGATVFLDDSGGPGGLPGDVLSADTTGTSIVAAYDAATFTLTLTGNDTLENYEKVLRTVAFSSGDDPDGSVADPGNYLPIRVIGMTVDDGKKDGVGLSAPIFVQVIATGAQDDAFTIWENRTLGLGEDLFDDNGDGFDSGPDFDIVAVNGNAGNVDTQITLPSGALLTVNADGTFDYDPNGAFDYLPGALSGATNLTATDSFTYTLLGGYTATVTVTIKGIDSDGDLLIGNASDNSLNGGFGADTMQGKGGNDTYVVNSLGDVVVEVAGEGAADRVTAQSSYALSATADIELLTTTNSKGTTAIDLQGNALAQTIIGNDGDNFLNDGGTAGAGLGSSPDILIGRGGNDTYAVYNAAAVIVEGKNDGTADRVTAGVSYVLAAGVYVEYLNTTAGLATTSINLTGNELSQVITGNEGNNVLDGGKGAADILKGQGGNDTYYVRNAGDYIIENVGEGFDRVTASLSYVLTADAEVEVLNTTSRFATYAIDLTGNRLGQTITGNYGDNILNDGGKGAADKMEGLAGNDTYYIYNAGDVVVENAGEGTDRVAAGVSYQLTAGAEVEYLQTTSVGGTTAIDLTGNTLSQTITGNAGDNVLHSGGIGGADILRGFGGNDTYRVFNAGDLIVDGALQGADRVMAAVDYTLGKGVEIELFTTNGSGGTSGIDLTGNEIGQEIVGNTGANRLDGKGGNDTLRGLGGNDMFVFSTALGAGNVDTIVDFNPAGDRIELHKSVFAALAVTGPLLSGYFRANAGGTAQDTNDHILYDTVTGNLYYDADANGAGAAVHFATLTGVPSLSAADFVVV